MTNLITEGCKSYPSADRSHEDLWPKLRLSHELLWVEVLTSKLYSSARLTLSYIGTLSTRCAQSLCRIRKEPWSIVASSLPEPFPGMADTCEYMYVSYL